MKAIGYTVSTVVIMFLLCVFSGYTLSILWQWFVMPIFPAPELTIPTAIGLAMIVTYLTHQDTKSDTEGKGYGEILLEMTLKGIGRPAGALFFGWIVTLFL